MKEVGGGELIVDVDLGQWVTFGSFVRQTYA